MFDFIYHKNIIFHSGSNHTYILSMNTTHTTATKSYYRINFIQWMIQNRFFITYESFSNDNVT
jgi:hypothetical protein